MPELAWTFQAKKIERGQGKKEGAGTGALSKR
jgi:hypothetical protein